MNMKITYIKLVNFCNIDAVLKSHKIEIDFSENKNKIILLTGPNGSGKTSLLSCLHPFAYNGNLDVRSELPIIVSGRNGEKEIHIEDGGNTYVIKHFYTPSKESHTVKSYIQKNGVELNTNGNVTSFKDVIKEELELETDFLKLIRLGANVTNFIDLKATERKSFMGKILSEVDIYLMYYKKITTDLREVKSVISHLSDKLQKLGVSGKEDELLLTKDNLAINIKEITNKINKLRALLGGIENDLNKFESGLLIKESIDTLKKKLDKIYKSLQDNNISVEECASILNRKTEELVSKKTKIESIKDTRDTLLNSLNKLMDELDMVDKELSKISNNTDISDAEFIVKELRNNIETRSKELHLADYTPPCSKADMESLIVDVDRCNDILYTTYEFGRQPIEKAISCISSKQSIINYTEESIKRGNKNKLQNMCEYVYKEISKKMGNIKINCSDGNKCAVYKFYDELYNLATEIPDTIVEDETFLTYLKLSYQNIMTIADILNTHRGTIDKLPDNLKSAFKMDEIFSRIKDTKSLCEKEPLYSELSMITEYELQESDREKLKLAKEKLSLLKKSVSNSEYFENRRSSLIDDIDDTKSKISDITNEFNTINSDISELESDIINYTELKEALTNKESIQSEYDLLCESFVEVSELTSKRKALMEDLQSEEKLLAKCQESFTALEYKLTSYSELSKEMTKYSGIYDDMVDIRDSLSSKEGIPLYYIQIYLHDIKDITNDLLRIIYDDDLVLDDFDINADEFTIPYYTKGLVIKDVSHASQGERSFISLALSFALIYKAISKYNILLLDEIDSTLDTVNRMKFINILEKQIEMIDAEQVFLISHNNMFSMYPVSVINMKNMRDDENKSADLIKIKIH